MAPGGSAKRTFFLLSRANASINLKCEIAGAATSCKSGAQTFTIPPGTKLVIDALSSGNAPPTRVQFSWKGTAP